MVPPAFASRRPSILLIARITDALAAFDSHAYSPYVPPRATRSKQIAAECRAVHVLAIRRGLTMQRTSGVGRFRDRGLVRDLRNVLVSRLSALFYYSERNTARTKKKRQYRKLDLERAISISRIFIQAENVLSSTKQCSLVDTCMRLNFIELWQLYNVFFCEQCIDLSR